MALLFNCNCISALVPFGMAFANLVTYYETILFYASTYLTLVTACMKAYHYMYHIHFTIIIMNWLAEN